ncbi:MAG: 2-amino-4-hydroxy-6-hydroxymethyldihydropteridine diphosphokinase [Candidatus Eiseniibacteriota bacterium]
MTEAFVALGANLGRPEQAIRDAVRRLAAAPGIEVRAASRMWRSEPWGLADQPEFVNAVVTLRTSLGARELLAILQGEELRAGRRPAPRNGPRILDLDLLTYGDEMIAEPGLTLPHPGIASRTFVLEPLREAAPSWRHPALGKSAEELLAELHAAGGATRCRPIPGAPLWPAGAVEEAACLG